MSRTLKVFEVENNPLGPSLVAWAAGMASNDRQPNLVVVASSKAEAIRTLDEAHVSFTRGDVRLSDESYPPVAALRTAGQLDEAGVLAFPSTLAARVVRFAGGNSAGLVGWMLRRSNTDVELVKPGDGISQVDIDALALILGGPGCTGQALAVLAAGYRLVQNGGA